ncbi:MAG: transposase [Nitrosopumilaceae archaeon]|nr:transposase [Nitrosopumilaceae archaeon]
MALPDKDEHCTPEKSRIRHCGDGQSFFIHNDSAGRKYWSPIGVPVRILHARGRRRLTVFSAATDDGRQLFRTTIRGFSNRTFIPYVRALLRRFKRVALILDRASTHRSKLARKTFDKNKNVELIYLPKASPYLNTSEQC